MIAGVYVHIPFCARKCSYCDFTSFAAPDNSAVDGYLDALSREIRYVSQEYDIKADTFYIGGGTPSLLTADRFGKLASDLSEAFGADVGEFTVECNPDSVNDDLLTAMRLAGVTRVSLGVQSLNDSVLRSAGRLHDSVRALSAAESIVSRFDLSVDQILGLPHQSVRDVMEFIETFSDLGAVHFSCYGLKVEKGTPLYAAVDCGAAQVADEDLCADMYDAAYALLTEKGYGRYEVSNFARTGKESVHNLKYWEMKDYIGFGLSAHSLVGNVRYYNVSDLGKYIVASPDPSALRITEEVLTSDERLRERIMLGLRLERGIDIDSVNSEFGIDFIAAFKDKLALVERYTEIKDGRFYIKPHYMCVMNGVINSLV